MSLLHVGVKQKGDRESYGTGGQQGSGHQKVTCHEEDLDTRDVHQPPRKATFSLLKAITII